MARSAFISGFGTAAIVAARVAETFATTAAERVVVERTRDGRVFVHRHADEARAPDRIGVYDRSVTMEQILSDCGDPRGEDA